MYEIAVINPRPKKARRKAGRKSGVRKMAKRKKVARGAGGRFKKRAKSAAPRKARKARRVAAAAPKRRRKRPAGARPATGYVVGSGRIRRYKLNPRRRASRRRRSNPRFSLNSITSQLAPAAYGAGGAIALDVALGYIPLPPMLKTGYAKHAVKIVGALGIGMLAGKFLPGNAKAIGSGALTVAMYGLLKDVLVKFAPQVKGLGDYEEVIVTDYPELTGVGAYLTSDDQPGPVDPGVGAYMSGAYSMDGMDF